MGSGKGSRAGWLFLVSIAFVAVAGGYLGASRRPGLVTATQPEPATVESSSLLDVHVAGEVTSPGVVQVPEGSIVADAVAAAGGLTERAVPSAINLAAPLQDGDQVFVPGVGADSASATSREARIPINRATAGELEALPGVGPVLAERIVAYREEHGSFKDAEGLLDVPGIGESKLASIRDLIRVP